VPFSGISIAVFCIGANLGLPIKRLLDLAHVHLSRTSPIGG